MHVVHIRTAKHIETGLLMAQAVEHPGFIVHAHSEKELQSKMEPALREFLEALLRSKVTHLQVVESGPDGFAPPIYVANAEMAKAAA